jgi:proliferating cell nuclear antigen PCNA
MRVQFRSTVLLKKLCDLFREIQQNKMTMELHPTDGMYLQAVDPSRVCLATVYLRPSGFETYVVPEESKICLDVGQLSKVLKFCVPEQTLDMSLGSNMDTLLLQARGIRADGAFTLPLQYIAEDDLRYEVPTETPPEAFVATYGAADLSRLIKDLSAFGETLKLESSDGHLVAKMDVHDGNTSARITLHHDHVSQTSEESAIFGMAYLNSILGKAVSSKVTLELLRDRPLVFAFDVSEYDGTVRVFLAPKIDDGDSAED